MSNLRIYSYEVAGLTFAVSAPENFDIERLLSSFAPFRVFDIASDAPGASTCSATGKDRSLSLSKGLTQSKGLTHRQTHMSDEMLSEPNLLFRFNLQSKPIDIPKNAERVEEDDNDMGHTRLSKTWDGSYYLEIGYHDTGIFIANPDFSRITASIDAESPECGSILTSMLRIVFAQAVLPRDGISIHASAVAADGKAFLFLGKSGTGKSTHARMWLRNIPGSRLLNDDNPTLRLIDGKPVAFGTPWSGKTPCYRNESYPVGGIARLVQSDADIFTEKRDVAAFVALLPSCSVVHSDSGLQSRLCDTITRIIELVPVGELKCLPDDESAIICYNNFKSLIK